MKQDSALWIIINSRYGFVFFFILVVIMILGITKRLRKN